MLTLSCFLCLFSTLIFLLRPPLTGDVADGFEGDTVHINVVDTSELRIKKTLFTLYSMKDTITHKKKMTLKKIAEITGAAYSTVAEYAQRAGWTKNGKKTLLDERQVTVILEAMKQATNNQSNLPSRLEGIKTGMSIDLQIALAERNAKELWKRKALEQEARTMKAEWLLEQRAYGLESYQRYAEYNGLTLSDRDDVLATYGKR